MKEKCLKNNKLLTGDNEEIAKNRFYFVVTINDEVIRTKCIYINKLFADLGIKNITIYFKDYDFPIYQPRLKYEVFRNFDNAYKKALSNIKSQKRFLDKKLIKLQNVKKTDYGRKTK
jgi:hypothetical protein